MQYESRQEVVLMHYVKPLLLGLIMEKFKTRGLDSDQTVAAIIATQNAECDPTLSEEQVNLPKLDHKAKELQSN
jgi:hypothetical protein